MTPKEYITQEELESFAKPFYELLVRDSQNEILRQVENLAITTGNKAFKKYKTSK